MANPLGMMALLCGAMILFWGVVIGVAYLIIYLNKRADSKVELRPSKASQSANIPITQTHVSARATNQVNYKFVSVDYDEPLGGPQPPVVHTLENKTKPTADIAIGNKRGNDTDIKKDRTAENRSDTLKKKPAPSTKSNISIDFGKFPSGKRMDVIFKFDQFMKHTILKEYERNGYVVGSDMFSYNLRKRNRSFDYKIFGYKYTLRKGTRIGTSLTTEWNRTGDILKLGIAHASRLMIFLFISISIFSFLSSYICSIVLFHFLITDIFSSLIVYIPVLLLALIPGIIGSVIGAILSNGINRLLESKEIKDLNDKNENYLLKVAEEKIEELKRVDSY